MTLLNFQARLRQFYLMPKAIAEADARAQQSGRAGLQSSQNARLLLATALVWEESSEQNIAALALLREALVFALQGLVQRGVVDAEESNSLAIWNQLDTVANVAPVIKTLSVNARDQIACLLSTGLTTEYVERSDTELSALVESLLRTVRSLVSLLEDDICVPQRLRAVRLVRWTGSMLALLLFCSYGGWKIHKLGTVANLAFHQGVTTSSSFRPDLFPPDTLVDGLTTQLGCHTETQENPWAQIDLGGKETVHRVVVSNRPDGLTERAIPLVIETSLDGKQYEQFARQNQDFKTWTATPASPVKARYVRLKVLNTTVLHLAEVEVY